MGDGEPFFDTLADEGRGDIGDDLGIRLEKCHVGKGEAVAKTGAGVNVKGHFLEEFFPISPFFEVFELVGAHEK